MTIGTPLKDPARILCIRLDNMGDVLMTTPAIRALRERFPLSEIHLLTSRLGSAIAPFIPLIDDTIVYDAPWVRTYAEPPASHSVSELTEKLARRRYSAAVIFSVYTQSPLPAAMLAYQARIPVRAAHCHENPYGLLTHWIPDPEPGKFIRHEVERQLALVTALDAVTADRRLSLRLPVSTLASARRKLTAVGVDPKHPWILLHPGCTEARRLYPAGDFADAARLLVTASKARLVISGGPDDTAVASSLVDAVGPTAVSLAGRTSIGELAALISLAPLLVSVNTVTAHIAAAVGTPVVDIYARTNPQHTPWMVPSRVLYFDVSCRDCERGVCGIARHPPMQTVSPEQVAEAAQSLLEIRQSARVAPRRRLRRHAVPDSLTERPQNL